MAEQVTSNLVTRLRAAKLESGEALRALRREAADQIGAQELQIEDRDQALQSLGLKLERLRALVRVIHDETRDNARHYSSDSYLPIHIRQQIEDALHV